MAGQAKTLLTAAGLEALFQRVASEVREQEVGHQSYALVGIHTRGVPIAKRIAKLLDRDPDQIGVLDINLYRDDLSQAQEMPLVKKTELPFSVDGAHLLLVDDVLYTGRTIRAALDAITDLGRPKKIALLVLIDRGERELPIQPDFCGKTVSVAPTDNVKVRLQEIDGEDLVEVLSK